MENPLEYPFDPHILLRKKRAIKRSLLEHEPLFAKRIAILGGSTTDEIREMLELFLLDSGINPVFYESEYNKYYEDVMFGNAELQAFKPDLIYIHTSSVNINGFPPPGAGETDVSGMIDYEVNRLQEIWNKIEQDFNCPVIQNNFELPYYRVLGNLDAHDPAGKTFITSEINNRIAREVQARNDLYLNDINYLSSWLGLSRWYDRQLWYSYKYAMSYEAIPYLAHNLASIINAIYGIGRKAIVLDLDNTLWGGVIGDDGVNGIQIGNETALGEAFSAFQKYLVELRQRGVLLTVCSKNDEAVALTGFSHPDSILSAGDFSAFIANWNPKHDNIERVTSNLNIGNDSLVLIDDNPVERNLVRSQLPMVGVPDVGNDVSKYIELIDKSGYFETVTLSKDDMDRAQYYSDNKQRTKAQAKYKNYDEYLQSLEMEAEIRPFSEIYLDRITQLVNKTNQFNTTTRRYTGSEIREISHDANWITLYGRLRDKFGDNGLVTVAAGQIENNELHIWLWLMSCRVLKRDMELAMMDALVAEAVARGINRIIGYYFRTERNSMVSDLYKRLGFSCNEDAGDRSVWYLQLGSNIENKNKNIKV